MLIARGANQQERERSRQTALLGDLAGIDGDFYNILLKITQF
jgi:hypothetical protein